MDFINKVTGGDNKNSNSEGNNKNEGGGGGFMDKINGMAGGGAQGEKNEDGLDKAIDYVQENFMGQGQQSNETAAEQAKDEAISDAIRSKYKDTTGNEFFIKDSDKKYGA